MTKRRWSAGLLLVIILVVAVCLRLPGLGLSLDWSEAELLLGENLLGPPLSRLLVSLAGSVSSSEWWLRLVGCLIPGLLAIGGTYALGSKLADKNTGLLAALLLATSSFHVYFSDKLWPYALAAAATVWSWFFLLEAVRVGRDSYALRRGQWLARVAKMFPVSHDMLFFLAVSLVGLYSSYFYLLVLVSQVVFLLWRGRKRECGFLVLIVGVAALAWVPGACQQWQELKQGQMSLPAWAGIVSLSLWQAPALTLGKFIFGVTDLEMNWFYVSAAIILVLLALECTLAAWMAADKKKRERLVSVGLIFGLPVILAWGLHWLWPIVTPGRLLLVLPVYYLSLSLIMNLSRAKLAWAGQVLVVMLLTANVWGVWQYYQTGMARENWRELNESLHEEFDESRTVLVFAYPGVYAPWRWYEASQTRPFPTLTTGVWQTAEVTDWERWRYPLSSEQYQTVVMIDYFRSLTDPDNLLPQVLQAAGWQLVRTLHVPGFTSVRIYSKRLVAEGM